MSSDPGTTGLDGNRKAALKYHPDKNRDKPNVGEKFKGKSAISTLGYSRI